MSKKLLVFVSNYFNHHQSCLCDDWYNENSIDFIFVETNVIPQSRIKNGYKQLDRPYLIKSYSSDEDYKRALNYIENADVVICGSAPRKMISRRIKQKKLVFYYNERLFKKKTNCFRLLYWYFKKRKCINKNCYLLCASAYAAQDFAKLKLFKGKMLKWGYFPMKFLSKTNDMKQRDPKKLLWCGRLIKYKHPEFAINSVIELLKDGIDCNLTIIGTGPLENELKEHVKNAGLEHKIIFLGGVDNNLVHEYMKESSVFLLTSNFEEGWGAVLNEAMSQGCVCISSHSVGAAPYLIKNGFNGFLYKYGDSNGFRECIRRMLFDENLRLQMSLNAVNTIKYMWNAEIAAKRFVDLINNMDNENYVFDKYIDGPLSKAEIIPNDWY